MSLNIKNEEAHAAASELAKLRNVSVTQAVLDAVRRDLAREKARTQRGGLANQLLEIGKRCSSHITKPVSSKDHAAILYDDQGLPR